MSTSVPKKLTYEDTISFLRSRGFTVDLTEDNDFGVPYVQSAFGETEKGYAPYRGQLLVNAMEQFFQQDGFRLVPAVTTQEYAKGTGSRCPICKSSAILGQAVDIQDTGAYQPITCENCGAEWTDWYQLAEYIELDTHS